MPTRVLGRVPRFRVAVVEEDEVAISLAWWEPGVGLLAGWDHVVAARLN